MSSKYENADMHGAQISKNRTTVKEKPQSFDSISKGKRYAQNKSGGGYASSLTF